MFTITSKEIDTKEVLKYPLTPGTLTFCHFDGSLRDTPKSLLSRDLKRLVLSSEPSYINVISLDGNFYLHLLSDIPTTFGGISRKLLGKICNLKAPRR